MSAKDPMSRSENMSRIKSKDTKPEMVVRRALHARGFRFRVHRKDLPGKPDVILPRWNAVIQVNGCYWHGHGCLGRSPKTNTDYWGPKIARNRDRDQKNVMALRKAGWRVLIIWECALVGKGRWDHEQLFDDVEKWIRAGTVFHELAGKNL